MLLTLKNKTVMGIERMIKQANDQEFAVIKEIEMIPSEVFQLLTEIDSEEMKDFRKEIRSYFKVSGTDDAGNDANIFDFFALKRDFVDKWVNRVYVVTYRDVPLQLFKERRGHLK